MVAKMVHFVGLADFRRVVWAGALTCLRLEPDSVRGNHWSGPAHVNAALPYDQKYLGFYRRAYFE